MEEFGTAATKKAFGKSRSAIYLWKQKVSQNGYRLSALLPQSKAPKSPRKKRRVTPELVDFILQYRELHPGVGKETIKPALDTFSQSQGLTTISESTIGRIIGELKEKGLLTKTNTKLTFSAKTGRLIERVKRLKKKLRRGNFIPKIPGDLVQADTIEIFYLGLKRYIFTALDVTTAFGFALSYKSKTSVNAQDFLQKFLSIAPFPIKRIQTDNGSEFHDSFDHFCEKQNMTHIWNYPGHPQSNSYLERFNRTIQEQYISWHLDELTKPQEFNQGLMNYLLWYNTEKPHKRLCKISPLRYYLTNFIAPKKSNMLWTLTSSLRRRRLDKEFEKMRDAHTELDIEGFEKILEHVQNLDKAFTRLT